MNIWRADKTYAQGDMVQYSHRLFRGLQDANENNVPLLEGEDDYWALYIDPITQVYYALWSLLESHVPLAALVTSGNRIKFAGSNRDPIKAEASEADLPELRIVPVSTTPHLQRTSNSSSILKRFRIEVSTGDQRVDAGLFAIEWELYRALVKWQSTLTALVWGGVNYVKLARPASVQDGVTQADLERGIKGWASLWECEVELWFDTAAMQADDNEEEEEEE